MKKRLLLNMAMLLATATAAQAQVVMTESFDAEQTKQATDVGYYEFINTQEGDEREVKDGALHFYNAGDVEGQNWQRAVKFRNLPVKENTSYRVTVKLMGSNEYSVDGETVNKCKARFALMQGGENLDMGFLASDGTQQLTDISYFQTPDEGKGYCTYTGLFYYTTDAAHKAWYKEQYPEKEELPATYFLTLNVYNPGDFYIDEVVVEEASVTGIAFRDDVIRVDFGYAVDTKTLLAGRERALLPNESVTVKLNGKEIGVLTTELFSDGKLYIFLDDEYPQSDKDKVEVSFTNPGTLQYAEGKTPGGAVLNFADVAAVYDDAIDDVYSFAFVTPTLVSADPENGSFNLPVSTKEFKLVFDKPVDVAKVEATLESQKLTVSPATGTAEALTLTRTGADLAAGEYTLKVTKIYPELVLADDIYGEETLTLSFGSVTHDPSDTVRVVMTDGFVDAGNGAIAEKWEVLSDSEVRIANGGTYGSGCRIITGLSGDITEGLYLCSRGNNDGGYAYYGSLDGEANKLRLAPGKYQLTLNCARWDSDEASVQIQVCSEAGNVLAESLTPVSPRSNGSTSNAGATKIELNFRVTAENNYVLKFFPRNNAGQPGGWGDGIVLGNIQLKYLPAAAGVDETNMLNTALADAKAALDVNADERYAGADYNTLKAVVEKHDGKATVYTAPSVFRAAAQELTDATDALKQHKNLCDTYDPLVDNAKYARDQRTETKFERHATYAAIEAAIEKYDGKVLTDNGELAEAIDELTTTTAAVTNVGRVVENLTAAHVTGLATLQKIEGEEAAADIAAKVDALLTDDDAVRQELQTLITLAAYKDLSSADSQMFATKLDEVTLEESVDSFDVSVFMVNPLMYHTGADDKTASVRPSSETLPGWTLTPGSGWEGGFTYHYPWGASAQYAYDDKTCPAAAGMIAAWSYTYRVEQTIENLPAGVYSLVVGTGQRDAKYEPQSYIFATTTAQDYQQVIPAIAGSVEPDKNCIIEDIVVTDGRLTIGFQQAESNQTFLNGFHLYLKDKADGYDYAKGFEEIAAGVLAPERTAEVTATELYDLNGRRLTTARRGLVLVKKTLSDGTVRTEKLLK